MKVYQLIWKLIKEFGLFGEVDAKVARYATDTIRDAMLDKHSPEIRERFTQMVNHKVTPEAVMNSNVVKQIVSVHGTLLEPVDPDKPQFDDAYDFARHLETKKSLVP